MSAPRKEKHLPNCKAKVTSILHFRKRPRNTHYWDEQRSMIDNGGSGHRGFWCLGRIAKSRKDRCSVGSPSRDYRIFLFVCLIMGSVIGKVILQFTCWIPAALTTCHWAKNLESAGTLKVQGPKDMCSQEVVTQRGLRGGKLEIQTPWNVASPTQLWC